MSTEKIELTPEQLKQLEKPKEEEEEQFEEEEEEEEKEEKIEKTEPKEATFKAGKKVIKVRPKTKPVNVECPYCGSNNTFEQYGENDKAPDGADLIFMYKGRKLKSVYICGNCRRRFGLI